MRIGALVLAVWAVQTPQKGPAGDPQSALLVPFASLAGSLALKTSESLDLIKDFYPEASALPPARSHVLPSASLF